MARHVLIIEDDADFSERVKHNLVRQCLKTIVSPTGELGLSQSLNERNPPMLIMLDLMLPGMSGTELCRRFRREPLTRRTPIIILTAKGSESDRVTGLDLGADDYITKPFSVRELLARVRAVLRRLDERSEEHTSELQSRLHLVCRLLLEKKKKKKNKKYKNRKKNKEK